MGLKPPQQVKMADEQREALKSLSMLILDQQIMLEDVAEAANESISLSFHVKSVLLHMGIARLELENIGF